MNSYQISLLFLVFINLNLKAITIEKSFDLCTKKSSFDFTNRVNDLNTVYLIDDKYLYPLKDFELIKIRALNMIKSQSLEKDGKLYWLLEFRPLPEQTQLPLEHYPRIIMQCNRTEKSLDCNADKERKETFRVFKDFSFSLKYVEKNPSSIKCPSLGTININYKLEIDDNSFEALKAESLRQLTGSDNNILGKIIDKLFVPKVLFETYIQYLYEQW
jgi:hypothetical protein